MSSFIAPTTAAATKTPYTKFLEGFVYTYPFPMPQPRPSTSDYKAAFKTYSKTSADTLQLMEDLTNHRIQMLSVVSTNGPLTEQISTLELYLQDVHNLHESLMVALDAKQNVACDREIGFEWALYLNSRPPFRSSSLVFEMIMLYHMKAQMHYRTAQLLLTTDYASFASEAGKQFLLAASIYDLLHTNISNSKWDRKFHPKEINPPECSPAVCTAMSFYCRSRAQATALLKAQVENKVSAMVKTRLALGAAHLASQSCDAFVQSQPPYTKKEMWVFPPLLAAVGSDRELNRALGQHFLAMHCADPAATGAVGGVQLGQALSCTALAKLLLQEQRFPFYEIQHPGLPKITQFPYTGLSHLRDVSVYLQSQWDETAPTWERENRMIYFQPLPRSVEEYVVPTPAEAIVANPAPFKPIEPLIFPFIDPPKALSVFSSFFGFGGGKSSSSAAAAPSSGAAEATSAVPPEGHLLSASMLTGNGVPDTRELTDEEFARELQRRMNLEASATAAAPTAAAAPAPSAPPLHGAAPPTGAPPRR